MTTPDIEALLILVIQMRRVQCAYFRSRTQEHLINARALEHQVDAALKAWIESQQLPLFTEDS